MDFSIFSTKVCENMQYSAVSIENFHIKNCLIFLTFAQNIKRLCV